MSRQTVFWNHGFHGQQGRSVGGPGGRRSFCGVVAAALLILGVSAASVSAQPVALPPGAVAWWPMDYCTGGNIAAASNDLVSTQGLVFNTPLPSPVVSGRVGCAVHLGSSSGGAQVPDRPTLHLTPDAGLTMMAWVRLDAASSFTYLIDRTGYTWSITGGVQSFATCGDNSNPVCGVPATSSQTVSTGSWHFVAVVVQGTTVDFYVDGSRDTKQYSGPTSNLDFSSAVVAVGSDVFGTSILQGDLDEVVVFGRALSQGEVMAIFNAGGSGMDKTDCQSDGLADSWQIEQGLVPDCNANGVPDECELAGNDCNEDGIPDECQPELDVNGNGVPDGCELTLAIQNPFSDSAAAPSAGTTVYTWSFGTSGSCVPDGWTSETLSAFRDVALEVDLLNVIQEDPCRNNVNCGWSFYKGSNANGACVGFPGQKVVPYGEWDPATQSNVYVWTRLKSPAFIVGTPFRRVQLVFDAYADLPMDNLVFYTWRVRSKVGGTWRAWKNRGTWFYGPYKKWDHHVVEIGDLIEVGATDMQVAVEARDFGGLAGQLGSGSCHTHAPLVTNVSVAQTPGWGGPAWYVNPADLFQDNFAEDGTLTGTVRADAARDLLPLWVNRIRPGDSCVVWVGGRLELMQLSGRDDVRIYVYVDTPPGGIPKSGTSLSGDLGRWPHLGTWTDSSSRTWDMFQLDVVRDANGVPIPDAGRYCFDFNDALFRPGDRVYYFFSATDYLNETTYWSEPLGMATSKQAAATQPTEFTCLPTSPLTGADVLYIDGCDGWGAQPAFDASFVSLGMQGRVDRFDVRAPTITRSSGIGSRVVNAAVQLGTYTHIIWNTGDLTQGTLANSKTDDVAPLVTFLENLSQHGGLFISGQSVAGWIARGWTPGTAALQGYIPFSFGGRTDLAYSPSPSFITVRATPNGGFNDPACNAFVVGQSCDDGREYIHGHEIVNATGTSFAEMQYEVAGQPSYSSVVSNHDSISASFGVVLAGFSFHHIQTTRDCLPLPVSDRDGVAPGSGYADAGARTEFLYDVFVTIGLGSSPPTGAGSEGPLRTELHQNVPNPFNPMTLIRFTTRAAGPVRLSVFDVVGRRIRTLVDARHGHAGSWAVRWDGRDDNGSPVASGVYFCRLVAGRETRVRKMVLVR